MKLLADENFPSDAVAALREHDHDVEWVREDEPKSSDVRIIARASTESRLLLTFDKDFSELAFRSGLPTASGIVLFRIRRRSDTYVTTTAMSVLDGPGPWEGTFTVVEEEHMRRRPLPDVIPEVEV